MTAFPGPVEPPFAAAGGIVVPVNGDWDPLEVLDDLMVVVEGLCPAWPQRGTFENMDKLWL